MLKEQATGPDMSTLTRSALTAPKTRQMWPICLSSSSLVLQSHAAVRFIVLGSLRVNVEWNRTRKRRKLQRKIIRLQLVQTQKLS